MFSNLMEPAGSVRLVRADPTQELRTSEGKGQRSEEKPTRCARGRSVAKAFPVRTASRSTRWRQASSRKTPLPEDDFNRRIVLFGRDGAQARQLAEVLSKRLWHNVAYFPGSFTR
jgi:hypothetical protein